MPFLLSDYITQVQRLVHDLSSQDFSTTELTDYVNGARQRCALDFHNVRQLFVNLQTIASQETYPITGGTGGVNITAGGANYTAATTVNFSGGGFVTSAAATPVISGGVITGVTMTSWGSGYTSTPGVAFNDTGGGSGATGTAVTIVNAFDIQDISVIWGSQRWMLSWLPFTPFQAFCRANITQFRYPGVWTTLSETNTFYYYPIPDQEYGVEIDAVMLPNNLVNTTDIDNQILLPVADVVKYYAAYLALLKLQNFDQADYYQKKYKDRVTELQTTRQTRRVQNVYRNWGRRLAGP